MYYQLNKNKATIHIRFTSFISMKTTCYYYGEYVGKNKNSFKKYINHSEIQIKQSPTNPELNTYLQDFNYCEQQVKGLNNGDCYHSFPGLRVLQNYNLI